MTRLQPRLEFIPPAFNPWVLWSTKQLLPLLLKLRLRPWLPSGISRIEATNVAMLVNLYQQFQAGKVRFLIAFRHPEVDDPLCMFHLLSRIVPRVARQQGVSLKLPVHSYFLYDRGMPLWAGKWLGWFFSCLGGVPIHRGRRPDRAGLRTVRDLFANGQFPLAIAPEGATNGHSEVVSPLEPGVAQIGFWCAEDLAKANREEQVLIVPVSIQYRYVTPPWYKLDRLLHQLEVESGLPTPAMPTDVDRTTYFYKRLFQIGEQLLSQMEDFYRQFYHQDLAPLHAADDNANACLEARLQRLMRVALQVTETYFDITPQGNIIERCRRLEEAGWQYIYREDVTDLKRLSPLHRGLGNWVAEEAALRMRHMRIVESFVAVTGNYVQQKPTIERFAETALLMFDMLGRIQGQKLPHRPRLGWREAFITVSEPISVTDRWHSYQSSRTAARAAVTQLTADLQAILESNINQISH